MTPYVPIGRCHPCLKRFETGDDVVGVYDTTTLLFPAIGTPERGQSVESLRSEEG
jgi:hypothetical protein